jgi:peroxiredoxin-like protein
MQPYPHTYRTSLVADLQNPLTSSVEGLPPLQINAPVEFDGPGDCWSPESLLIASVAGCFALTFRAVAQASGLTWETLECEVQGVLDKNGGKPGFVSFSVQATLTLPEDGKEKQALRLLEKAEENCLISNSLNAAVELEAEVWIGSAAT